MANQNTESIDNTGSGHGVRITSTYYKNGIGRTISESWRLAWRHQLAWYGIRGVTPLVSSLVYVSGSQLISSGKVYQPEYPNSVTPGSQITDYLRTNADMMQTTRNNRYTVPLLGFGHYETSDKNRYIYAAIGDIALPGENPMLRVRVLDLERNVLGKRLEVPAQPAVMHEGQWASAIALGKVVEFNGDLTDMVGTIGERMRLDPTLEQLSAVHCGTTRHLPQHYISGS